MNLELSYSHQKQSQRLQNKKCSICNTSESLLKLPDEYQEFAAAKGFTSFYCKNCIQVVNFLI